MGPRLFVITGGPCAGKTTLAGRLAALGFAVVPEAATEILREEGEGARRSPLDFQRKILLRQLRNEERALTDLRPTAAVFADRGIGDHFAYLRVAGCEPFEELVSAWARVRYEAVFFLEQSPSYEKTSGRSEPRRRARAIHEAIREEYLRRHPWVVLVPWAPLQERVEILLRAVGLAPPPAPAEKGPEDVGGS